MVGIMAKGNGIVTLTLPRHSSRWLRPPDKNNQWSIDIQWRCTDKEMDTEMTWARVLADWPRRLYTGQWMVESRPKETWRRSKRDYRAWCRIPQSSRRQTDSSRAHRKVNDNEWKHTATAPSMYGGKFTQVANNNIQRWSKDNTAVVPVITLNNNLTGFKSTRICPVNKDYSLSKSLHQQRQLTYFPFRCRNSSGVNFGQIHFQRYVVDPVPRGN